MRPSASSIISILCLLVVVVVATASAQDDRRAVYETEIDADVESVWRAFTTEDGLRSWMAPLIEIELEIGGKLRSNYDPEGEIGDAQTIESTILAYDPGRMLALKATGFPEGFAYEEAAAGTWSVFYFDAVSDTRTKITAVGLGYRDDPKSRELRGFFATANDYSLQQLAKALGGSESSEEME